MTSALAYPQKATLGAVPVPDSILAGATSSVSSQEPASRSSARDFLVVGRVDVDEGLVLEDGLRLASRSADAAFADEPIIDVDVAEYEEIACG